MSEVVIIGSGFAGLCMGIKLRQAGCEDFVILEKADDLGGTWRDNTYPGCACDIPSYLYSFSFEQNPRLDADVLAAGGDLAYLRHCADKYGIARHIRYGAEVTEAVFDEATGQWTVTVERRRDDRDRRPWSPASGACTSPSVPDLPGLDASPARRSTPRSGITPTTSRARRVAVIGTGASRDPVRPARSPPQVAQLDVYQRTPPWITPKPDRAIGPLGARAATSASRPAAGDPQRHLLGAREPRRRLRAATRS